MANIRNTIYRELNGRDWANAIQTAQKERGSMYTASFKSGTNSYSGTQGIAGENGVCSTASFAGVNQPEVLTRKKVDFNIIKL
jgi:hypothetical protein